MNTTCRVPRTLPAALIVLAFATFSGFAQSQKPAGSPKPSVRAITAFINLDRTRYQIQVSETVQFLKYAQTVFESRGYTVETLRIATQPFPEYTKGLSREEAIQFFKNLDGLAEQEHLIMAIGPAYLAGDDGDAQAELLAAILENTKLLNGSLMVTNPDGINWSAVKAAARVTKKLSETTEHSQGNFRFAALASVSAYTPFFPAAYHTGSGHQFAIGLESAGIIRSAVQNAPDLAAARHQLIDSFYNMAFDAEDAALRVDREQGWTYLGIDLSPAPSKDSSIGAAVEAISKQPFGTGGTLTAVGAITSSFKEIGARKIGFTGLMLPVLEDSRIADRWNNGYLTLDSLLSYSAVCGTGLDTVPLPGDVTVEELTRIIGDVATLSIKWNKPLTARLLPVAGKHAGEQSDFTDPNLVNGILQPVNPKESRP
jgi:uncharacterized protein (UPF0210 family)